MRETANGQKEWRIFFRCQILFSERSAEDSLGPSETLGRFNGAPRPFLGPRYEQEPTRSMQLRVSNRPPLPPPTALLKRFMT
eukprot:scaffold117137_cov79-Cyclotella_meneghiniana.AAC.1